MFVIAHAGHWATGVLQLAPLFIVAGVAVWRTYIKARSTPVACELTPSGASMPRSRAR